MVKIHLHGALGKKLGTAPIKMDVSNTQMMFAGLRSQVPGFEKELRKLKKDIRIVACDDEGKEVRPVSPETLGLNFGSATNVHIVPMIKGSGAEILAYLAITVATYGVVVYAIAYIAINIAIGLVLGAIANALAPSPDTSAGSERPETRASFIFNGPVNTVSQGGVVPLIYGETLTGSVVISAGVNVEELIVWTEDVIDSWSDAWKDVRLQEL